MLVRNLRARAGGLALLLAVATPASAVRFDLDYGDGIEGVLNTTLTAGGAWRMQHQSSDLIGKSNLDPGVCSGVYQSCQGLFREQSYPAAHLAAAPGAPTMHADDGDLSYDKGDAVQAVIKASQDLTLSYGDFTLFARWLYFYDAVNMNQGDYFPTLITAENADRTGITGDAVSNRYFERVYGPGEATEVDRSGRALKQAGTDLQLLDLNISGSINLIEDYPISFKIGRQTINWGESTLVAVNSINQWNPPNANNLYRVGMSVEEVFEPVGMLSLSFDPFYNASLELVYQYEWEPLEIPTPGTYFSTVDAGTDNVRDYFNLSFGGSSDDPDKVGYFLDNPLALITPSTAYLERAPDQTPKDTGQYGFAFKYYAENLNYGTEFGFYYMRYHSRLPYVSFIAADASCARAAGNAEGINATNTSEFLSVCNNIPGLAVPSARQQLAVDSLTTIVTNPGVITDVGTDIAAFLPLLTGMGTDPDGPYSEANGLDTQKIFFEYPENIDMFGLSFNTPLGTWAMQGEVSYRPDLPLQVSIIDVAFAASGPLLAACHDPTVGCAGTSGGRGFSEDGGRTSYGSSDAMNAGADIDYADTINLLVGHLPGSARAYPSFLTAYRGGVVGDTTPNSYVRGWEPFDVLQYDLGFTRVYSATENPFGASQVQLVVELAAVHVPGLPALDELQIDAPGVYTHASAGADGTGADGSRQACSTNPTCVVGPDGLRFNPTQADLDAFVDKFSWGYRVISFFKYESLFPGISLQPSFVLTHDVKGTSPGPAENFVEGRKSLALLNEIRFRGGLSFTAGYTWYTGAGENNLLRDRDFAQAFVKYQF